MSKTRNTESESGLTLVELVIAMSFAVTLSILVLSFMLNFWSGVATLENDSGTLLTRQNAGDRLRDTLNVATQLISQNSITDNHTLIGDPGDATGTHWLIIHAIPSTISMPASGSYTPVFYFTAPSINSSKNFIMNGAQPYYDEFVLYLNGTTNQLLLRTLVNPSATGDHLKTSCPEASATTSCPADAVMASSISSVKTRYFSRSGNTIDYTSITDPITGNYVGPDFPAVEVVELTLNLSKNSTLHGGQNTLNETIIRVALRNG